jgi:hypothetical protein
MHVCDVCHKTFDKKSEYDRHCKISSDCKLFSIENGFVFDEFVCEKCGHKFSNKGNLKKHTENLTKCTIKNNFEKLNKKIDKAIKNVGNNNIIINNSTNNNYVFAKNGEECLKHITKEVLLELLNMDSFSGICVNLMQDAYFNRGVPKNHNWCLAYPYNKNAGIVFDNEKLEFFKESTSKTIDTKFSNLMELLTPLLLEIIEEEDQTGFLNIKQKRNLFRMKHFCNVDELSTESSEIYESIHKMAYIQRIIPMETWRKEGFKGNHLSLKF